MKKIKLMDVWFNSFFGDPCKMKINDLDEIFQDLVEKEMFVINENDVTLLNLEYPIIEQIRETLTIENTKRVR